MTQQQLLEVLATNDVDQILKRLKGIQELPDIALFKKQYDPMGHQVNDKIHRPMRTVVLPDLTDLEGKRTISKQVEVNRISTALQRIITGRAVSFLFGNPPIIKCEAETDTEKKVLFAYNRILYDNKINSFNREVARESFRSTRVAECWFTVQKAEEHDEYKLSRPTKFKVRTMAFKPWEGNDLYPLFDDTGDMIAFSRQFIVKDEDNKETTHFEVYTAKEKIVYIKQDGTWQEPIREINAIGKIPIAFAPQDETEWAVVQNCIERLEELLSNFGDTNDRHASPKIFVEGKVVGFPQKGEPGGILEGTPGSKAYYLSWNHATEAVKLEIETLLRFIMSFTQTPDISFESVKGMGQIASETLRMLFLDAHLKVQDKREVFDAYLQRRTNIIKAFIAVIDTSLAKDAANLEIECEIQPFIISDQKSMVDMLAIATGGDKFLSQESAAKLAGFVDDTDAEIKRINAETSAEAERNRTVDVFEGAV